MIDINVDLLQWTINFLIKKTLGGTVKKLLKNSRKVCSSIIDNIWGADSADKQLISKFN